MVAVPSPLQELAAAACAAQSFQLKTEFNIPGGKTLRAQVGGHQANGRWFVYSFLVEAKENNNTCKRGPSVTALDDAIRQIAAMYPKAVLRPGSVKVSLQKGTTTGSRVQPVAVQAWHEAYGLTIPSLDDLAKQRKAAREVEKAAADDTVSLLRSGRAGVKEFSKRPLTEKAKTDLRKVDLSGCDLSGVQFYYGARLNGALLAGARLTKTDLSGCKCGDADFARADLTGAAARAGTFLRVNFAGADLTDVELSYADLRGANFTDATLTGCRFNEARFDEKTRWPEGFKPPDELKWKGIGPDPRQAPTRQEKARPKPTDFAGFLDRLKKVSDASKLDKAMKMLKAERFQLFARVQPDHLVGVVKSQSSPTLVYSCRLTSDGKYGCCTQNLNVCGGLRGSPCKHLLVLLVGLTKAGELDPGTAHDWTQASRGQKAELDKDAMTETLLQYKGAEAGEVDWRPTETIPEDFYAM